MPIGQSERIGFGARARTTRNVPDTSFTNSLRQCMSERPSPEMCQNFEGFHLRINITVGESARLFVRTIEFAPELCRLVPASLQLQRERTGRPSGSWRPVLCQRAPVAELAHMPAMAQFQSKIVDRTRLTRGLSSISLDVGRFRASRMGWAPASAALWSETPAPALRLARPMCLDRRVAHAHGRGRPTP